MRRMLVLILVTGIFGCTSVKYAPFATEQYPPTVSVQVFSSPDAVGQEYVEIGLLTADDNAWGTSEVDLIEKLRKKAGQVGAHAVILQYGEQVPHASAPVGGMSYQMNKRIVRAVAIRYK